jgi:hypothetical protein
MHLPNGACVASGTVRTATPRISFCPVRVVTQATSVDVAVRHVSADHVWTLQRAFWIIGIEQLAAMTLWAT